MREAVEIALDRLVLAVRVAGRTTSTYKDQLDAKTREDELRAVIEQELLQMVHAPDGWLWMTNPTWNGGKPIPVQLFTEGGKLMYRPFNESSAEFLWNERSKDWTTINAMQWDGFSVDDNVVVYDRYRFVAPVTGTVVAMSNTSDAMTVALTSSNSSLYPVGVEITVSSKQLRINHDH